MSDSCHGVLLAGGREKRMGRHAGGLRKCLLPWGKGTLLSAVAREIAESGAAAATLSLNSGLPAETRARLEREVASHLPVTLSQADARGVVYSARDHISTHAVTLLAHTDEVCSSAASRALVQLCAKFEMPCLMGQDPRAQRPGVERLTRPARPDPLPDGPRAVDGLSRYVGRYALPPGFKLRCVDYPDSLLETLLTLPTTQVLVLTWPEAFVDMGTAARAEAHA